jgi:hypothetical protein
MGTASHRQLLHFGVLETVSRRQLSREELRYLDRHIHQRSFVRTLNRHNNIMCSYSPRCVWIVSCLVAVGCVCINISLEKPCKALKRSCLSHSRQTVGLYFSPFFFFLLNKQVCGTCSITALHYSIKTENWKVRDSHWKRSKDCVSSFLFPLPSPQQNNCTE